MAGEDFSLFALADSKPPIVMFGLGAVDPAKIKTARERHAFAEFACERISAVARTGDSDRSESYDQRGGGIAEEVDR